MFIVVYTQDIFEIIWQLYDIFKTFSQVSTLIPQSILHVKTYNIYFNYYSHSAFFACFTDDIIEKTNQEM